MQETLSLMGLGFANAVTPINLLIMFLSTAMGITIGCLPGLSAAMGVALPDNRYTEWTLDRPYYGVYYGYAALPMEPDRLTYLTSGLLDACTVYNYETGKTRL